MYLNLYIPLQFPNYEIVVTALRDEFPKKLAGKKHILTFIVIFVAFCLAIPQVTEVKIVSVLLSSISNNDKI